MSEQDEATHAGAYVRARWRLLFATILPGPVAGVVAAVIAASTAFADLEFFKVDGAAAGLGITYSGMLVFGAIFGAIWGTLLTLIAGLPMHDVLLRRQSTRAGHYTIAGGFIGLAPGVSFAFGSLIGTTADRWGDAASFVLAGAAAGTIGGLTFWLIRRPDRDTARTPPT